MKAKDKPAFVKETRELYTALNADLFETDPRNRGQIDKINRLIAIFTNFSSNDGQELKRLFQEYLKWKRRSTSTGTIRNRIDDLLQFIGQKIEEIDVYRIEDDTSEAIQERRELTEDKYDVAFSFAGEKRDYVSSLAGYIESRSNLRVFYDDNEEVEMWGKNLVDYFKKVFAEQANYCVMLISKEYAKKSWPNFERQIIQARSLVEEGILLPARFDDTEIDGEIPTVKYINISNMSPEDFGELVIAKVVGSGRYATRNERADVVTVTGSGEVLVTEQNPLLYIKPNVGRDGGPNGHFTCFQLKNMTNQVMLDISWGIRGFDYEWRADDLLELEPGTEKEVVYPISNEQVFSSPIEELNIFAEYRDLGNHRYFVRRQLDQVRVPSGAFFELKAAAFIAPAMLRDDGLKVLSDVQQPGDRSEMEFEIQTSDGTRRAKIGISRTFLSVWGVTEPSRVKQCLVELGHRKMRAMARASKVENYVFTTHDYPPEMQNGFEGYQKLRESIQ